MELIVQFYNFAYSIIFYNGKSVFIYVILNVSFLEKISSCDIAKMIGIMYPYIWYGIESEYLIWDGFLVGRSVC